MSLFDLLFPQPSPNRCKKVTKNQNYKNNHGGDNFVYDCAYFVGRSREKRKRWIHIQDAIML